MGKGCGELCIESPIIKPEQSPRVRVSTPRKRKCREFSGFKSPGKFARRRKSLVRRTHSPKSIPSPIYSPSPFHSLRLESTSNASADTHKKVQVRFLPPTAEGMKEAGRVLGIGMPLFERRNFVPISEANPPTGLADDRDLLGIVAFPTESVYNVGCATNNSKALTKLLENYENDQAESPFSLQFDKGAAIPKDIPIVNLLSTRRARRMARFGPPKKFALAAPSSRLPSLEESIQSDDESGRIDERKNTDTSLSSATSKSTHTGSSSGDEEEEDCKTVGIGSPIRENRIVAKFSEGAVIFDRLARSFWPGSLVMIVPANDKRYDSARMPLPKQVVLSVEEGGVNDYVAVSCPSHPLCRSFLKAAKSLVVSFSTHKGSSWNSAEDVQHSLPLSFKEGTSTIVPCINGETKRETFTVPSCQQGKPGTMVLISERTRTLHVLKEGRNVSSKMLQAAILRGSNLRTDNDRSKMPSCHVDQIIASVLVQWTIVEH